MRALALAVGWAWIAAIAWLSLTPSPPHMDVSFGDKIGHFAAYGSLMFWFCQLHAGIRHRMALAAGFVAMGIALEFIQGAVGYRSFEVLDMAANTAGVLLGWGAATAIRWTHFFR